MGKGSREAQVSATVKREHAEQPLQRLIGRSSADGLGSSCDSISGLTGQVGAVTGAAKPVLRAETGLKEAAGSRGDSRPP